MIAGISLVIMHFVLASTVIIIVKRSRKSESGWPRSLWVQIGNLLGVLAIYSAFDIFCNLIHSSFFVLRNLGPGLLYFLPAFYFRQIYSLGVQTVIYQVVRLTVG